MRSIETTTLAFALVAACAGIPPASADSPPTGLSGVWSGQITALGQPAVITLTLKTDDGNDAGDILWGGKAQCRTKQIHSGPRDEAAPAPTLLLTITGSSGGFCDRFWNGTLELTPIGDGRLKAVFLNGKNAPSLQTTLTKAATPTP